MILVGIFPFSASLETLNPGVSCKTTSGILYESHSTINSVACSHSFGPAAPAYIIGLLATMPTSLPSILVKQVSKAFPYSDLSSKYSPSSTISFITFYISYAVLCLKKKVDESYKYQHGENTDVNIVDNTYLVPMTIREECYSS